MTGQITRRDFLRTAAAGACLPYVSGCSGLISSSEQVNDIQSELNLTTVSRILRPQSTEELLNQVHRIRRRGESLAVCGGRHSMGGQQFLANAPLIDSSSLKQIVELDSVHGLVRVGAGIQWPELYQGLAQLQLGVAQPWVVREKQTGVDRVSLGGSISSNVHGRGITAPPFISDVESVLLVNGAGELQQASRTENPELFALVCGGYGLFGVIAEVTLRLVRRVKVRRRVKVIPLANLLTELAVRRQQGFLFGDCQYAVDLDRLPEAYPGVFSCYEPIADTAPIAENNRKLSAEQWGALYELTRTDKPQAFRRYSEYYLATDGQEYWSDTHQLAGDFFQGYLTARRNLGTELISEFYVSEQNLFAFLMQSQKLLQARNADLTFGTIRFIKQDTESFLAWATEDLVCIVGNLHVPPTSAGRTKVAEDFRALIDLVLSFGGRYYLTYHRFASAAQLVRAYPQFPEFLALKQKYDPAGLFQSNWYQHYNVTT